jgi:hypothetical protein
MFAGLLLLIIVTMKLFPDIPASRLLHRAFVEAPLRGLAAMDRRHLIYGAILLVMLFAGAEMIMLLGSADMAMLMAWDVSLYVDALIATWTIAAIVRGKVAWQALVARVTGARPRAPRRRRREGSKAAANDADEDGRAWAYALAA